MRFIALFNDSAIYYDFALLSIILSFTITQTSQAYYV